jgi:YspA, cpYpsA-related SLOG family
MSRILLRKVQVEGHSCHRRSPRHTLRTHNGTQKSESQDSIPPKKGKFPMRLLVCGGRDFADAALLYATLDEVHREFTVQLVIEGDADGADRLAGRWAMARDVALQVFPALWKIHGHRAGPIRNQQMLDEGKPDLVVAFPTGGPGTRDMIARARRNGFAVRVIVSPAFP